MIIKCITFYYGYENINIYIHMLSLCCYMFRTHKAIFWEHLRKDTNSLYANQQYS
jgi:hypothetical protein